VRHAAHAAILILLVCGTGTTADKPFDVKQAGQEALTESNPTSSPRLLAAQEAYDIANLKHREEVFNWQHTASVIIFWMVLSLVLAGVTFSAIQFGVALRRRTEFSDAEIAMSVEGVKIRSQFLGIITLALSLAFFYLYLKTVYPVVELSVQSQTAPAKR
jgi:hypothetical protein